MVLTKEEKQLPQLLLYFPEPARRLPILSLECLAHRRQVRITTFVCYFRQGIVCRSQQVIAMLKPYGTNPRTEIGMLMLLQIGCQLLTRNPYAIGHSFQCQHVIRRYRRAVPHPFDDFESYFISLCLWFPGGFCGQAFRNFSVLVANL